MACMNYYKNSMNRCFAIKTVFLHTHQKPTSKDIYQRKLTVKLSQLRSGVVVQLNHSASRSTAYFVVNIVIVSWILRIQVVGVELSNVEQLIVAQDRKLSKKPFWRCDQRGDEWAHQIRLRIQRAVSDLHAADAQYHKECMAKF